MSGAGLGEAANSGNPANQHSELQEQFIADIVQGVIADELLDYKETLQFAETALEMVAAVTRCMWKPTAMILRVRKI